MYSVVNNTNPGLVLEQILPDIFSTGLDVFQANETKENVYSMSKKSKKFVNHHSEN